MSEAQARTSVLDRPWYPYLASATSVLALAAQNADRGVAGSKVALLLVFSLAMAGVLWILAGLLVRDSAKRGLLALIGVTLVVWFGSIRSAAAALASRLPMLSGAVVIAALLVALGLASLWTLRTRRDFSGSVRFLNVAFLTSLVVSSLPLLSGTRAGAPEAASAASVDALADVPGAIVAGAPDDPDIFLIILDAYTGHSSLLANYGLDISSFTDSLKTLGFVVPTAPRANYTSTYLALSAMLDWRYLDDVAKKVGPESQDRSVAYALLHDNATLRFLRDRGYRYVFFRSAYPPLNGTPSADVLVPERLASDFELVWLQSTLLSPALGLVVSLSCKLATCETRNWPFQPDAASAQERRFEELAHVAEGDRPTFVFAHVLLPHEPFLFGSDCEHVEPYWPESSADLQSPRTRGSYAAQVQCLNRKVLALVEQLIATRQRRTVILLQGDHGYGRMPFGRPVAFEIATPEQVAERLDVFAAYRLPDAGPDVVYDSISPVNVLPRVFGHYFGLSRPPLPDQSYWSSWEAPFRFRRVR